eukprot:snap_masked-scaffold_44-processed-gene-1.3-mRNA-1 protein AED:1.00 eAED:1.00 QI:0/-1/0/0/-1/1/1/0/77
MEIIEEKRGVKGDLISKIPICSNEKARRIELNRNSLYEQFAAKYAITLLISVSISFNKRMTQIRYNVVVMYGSLNRS